MSRYAEGTKVDPERSKEEIERTVKRYGAEGFFSAEDPDSGSAIFGFRIQGYWVRLRVERPAVTDVPKGGRRRRGKDLRASLEREWWRRWRVALLDVKSRLERVVEMEERVTRAFMPDIMLPDGSTVADHVEGSIDQAYEAGRVTGPLIRPALTAGEPIEAEVVDG